MATRLKVVMFTDRVGSSRAATDIGDANRALVNRAQESITREIAAETRGVVIKFLGDGHLLTFDSASDALRAGWRIQERIAERSAVVEEALRFQLRIGLDAGDVEVDATGDVRGHAADMAKRVESAGEAGRVVLTHRVLGVLPPRLAECEELRTEQLRGDDQPTRLYRLAGLAGESGPAFRNPFIVGGPVQNPSDFFGRTRQVRLSMTRLRTMQSLSIVGERRIGKSSLLRYLLAVAPEQLGPAYRSVYVDLLHPAARTLPGMLAEIQRQLGLERPAATLPEFCDRMTGLHADGVHPLIGLDELEMLIRLREEFSRDFCEALRSVGQLGHVALIVASRSSLREMYDRGALVSPLFNIMGSVALKELAEDEARDLVSAPRPGVAFTPQQVDEILRRGRGHPLRLQILCFHVAQAAAEGATDSERVWADAQQEIADMLGA